MGYQFLNQTIHLCRDFQKVPDMGANFINSKKKTWSTLIITTSSSIAL
jgi:hypothetical protein